jgi:ADP-ribose pyrophosphatase YjhB (NUDIX family)
VPAQFTGDPGADATVTTRVCYKAPVAREFSAGAVAVRRLQGRWFLAAIRPGGRRKAVWALPKGNVGQGESPEATAVRELTEETGVEGVSRGKLGDVKYVYTRDGQRIFKVVSFYLVRYRRGRIDDVPEAFRHEVDEARWLPLEEAPRLLAYRGEREMAEKALAMLETDAV